MAGVLESVFLYFRFYRFGVVGESAATSVPPFSLYLELESSDGVHLLLAKMRLQHMRFHHLDITPSHVKQNGVLLSMSVELPSRKERQNLLNLLNNCPEIRYFEGV